MKLLRRGFTLIELLIVMVIILILAGILFPVLSSAKGKAQQVKCFSQMRQIGMAIQMYASDHDDLLPIGGYDAPYLPPGFTYPGNANLGVQKGTYRVIWSDELVYGGYLKNYTILICPSARSNDYRYSYGVNGYLMGWASSIRLDTIDQPSNTLMVTEKAGLDWPAYPPSAAKNNPYYLPLEVRHHNQLNVLFADGHVGRVGYGELIEGGPIRWQP